MKSSFIQLDADYKLVCQRYGEENVLGIFNWGLNGKNTTGVLLPSFEDVCIMNKAIDSFIRRQDGSKIFVKDIRLCYRGTENGHSDFMESLYTEEYILNPKYEHIYSKLFRQNVSKFEAGARSGIPAPELKIALMKLLRCAMNENSNAVRFLKQVTDAEKLALEVLVQTIGDEGIFCQSKVAASAGVSRNTMTNLITKMEIFGVAKVQSCGPKGTYIKIIDDTLLNIRGIVR